jgi:hypothetical protein
MVDFPVHIDCDNMAMVEDVHLMLEHAICEKLRALHLEANGFGSVAEANG